MGAAGAAASSARTTSRLARLGLAAGTDSERGWIRGGSQCAQHKRFRVKHVSRTATRHPGPSPTCNLPLGEGLHCCCWARDEIRHVCVEVSVWTRRRTARAPDCSRFGTGGLSPLSCRRRPAQADASAQLSGARLLVDGSVHRQDARCGAQARVGRSRHPAAGMAWRARVLGKQPQGADKLRHRQCASSV